MPLYCCVYECQNDSELHRNKHFHQFPTNEKLKNAWKKQVRREAFIPSQYSYVCRLSVRVRARACVCVCVCVCVFIIFFM